MDTPDAAMMAVPIGVARFISSLRDEHLADLFSDSGVTIIESFAPYLFDGPNAVSTWSAGMRDHARNLKGLRHTFGEPQDFSVEGERAFFTLPTTWVGETDGVPFHEEGGWAFVLIREEGRWRLRSYGWAVTSLELDAT